MVVVAAEGIQGNAQDFIDRTADNIQLLLGGIGKSTNLFPALTLGCGAVGGSSSSNNISPLDLINIRRVAWGKEEEKITCSCSPDQDLVTVLTEKILQRLNAR
jgi:hypothetical protein